MILINDLSKLILYVWDLGEDGIIKSLIKFV